MIIQILTIPARSYWASDLFAKGTFRRILVPLDCSPAGEAVLPYVEAIAKRMKSSVVLLHVNTPPPRGVPVLHKEVVEMSRAAGKAYIEQICKRLQDQEIDTNFEVIDGTPAKTILEYAKEKNVYLIAMGTRGFSGTACWLCGSVTTKVLDQSEVPVLAIRYRCCPK